MLLHPLPALRQRLRMHMQSPYIPQPAIAGQAILNRQNNLRNDFQIAVHEHVERVRDDAFGGVLDRHDAVVRAVFADLGEHVGNGLLRHVAQTGTETADGGLMRERRLRAEIRNGHGLLQRQRAGHDFAVNRAELVVGYRPFVRPADALQHSAFAVRRVNFLAGLKLHVADGEHVLRALVEQPHDVRVQLVNHLAMFRNVHNQGRMQN